MLKTFNNLKITYKGMILVAVPLLFGTIFLVLLSVALFESEDEAKRAAWARNVLSHAQAIASYQGHSLAYSAAYLAFSNPDKQDSSLSRWKHTEEMFERLYQLIGDDKSIKKQADIWLAASTRAHNAFHLVGEISSKDERGILRKRLQRQLRSAASFESVTRQDFVDGLKNVQSKSHLSAAAWNEFVNKLLTFGLIMNVVLSLAAALVFGRSIGRRLKALADSNMKFTSDLPLNPVLQGNDEIAHLDKTLHIMAKELQAAARKQRALLDNAMVVICSLARDCSVIDMNPASIRVLGYAPEDLIGKSLLDQVMEDDRNRTRAAIQALKDRTQNELENRMVRKDGTIINVLWSLQWSDKEGICFCVAHDITERKLAEALILESEAQIRLILETIPVGVFVADQTGMIENLNQRGGQLFGASEASLRGSIISDLFVDENEHHVDLFYIRQQAALGTMGELMGRRSANNTFPVELRIGEFTLIGQQMLLDIVTDVSERRQVERLKREFVSMLSHDLKAPLTKTVSTMKLLLNEDVAQLDKKGKQKVDVIETEVDRLIALIEELLEVDKLASSQLTIKREPVRIDSIVLRAVSAVAYLAEKNSVRIVTDLQPLETVADSAKLVQVLVNLLGNAIKFSSPRSTISISVAPCPEGIEVKVADQGRGIPEAALETIFDRFKQVETSDRTEKKGTGLGLSICKMIIDAHNGTIGASSALNEGSTFWFRLPSH